MRLEGLIAAVFSPMHTDGSLDLGQVPAIVAHLIKDGVTGLYVCGSTGEGPLLSSQERRDTAAAYAAAAADKIPVIVQVGHDSLAEARALACRAREIGANAISAIAPRYFGCDSMDTLVACLREITSSTPDLPFFYYHIPRLSGTDFDMLRFLEQASDQLPAFAGIKYSATTVHEFQACLDWAGDRYSILFGCDEMLLSALSVGAYGAVGTTFNFAAPLYRGIIEAYRQSDLETAQTLQLRSVKMIRMMYERYRGQAGFKATMALLGLDCGPNRLPLRTLSESERQQLRTDLEQIGFFEWGRQLGSTA